MIMSSTIEKIKADLAGATKNSEKIKILLKLAWQLKNSSPNEALKYAKDCLRLAQKINNDENQADALNSIGVIHKYQGQYEQAKQSLSKALNIFKNLGISRGIVSASSNLGVVFNLQADYAKGLKYFLTALQMAEEIGNESLTANCCINVGLALEAQGKWEKALEYHAEGLEHYRAVKDRAGMAYAYNNSANIHKKKSKLQEALNYYTRSVEIREALNDNYGMAHSYRNIGEIYCELQQYDKALDYLFRALDIQEVIDDREGEAETLRNISRVYLNKEKVQFAMSAARRSLAVAKEIGAKLLVQEAYKCLSDAHVAAGNYRKAYQHYVNCVQIRDVLFNEERTKALASIQSKYEAEKKDREIAHLNHMNEELRLFASKASHDLKEPLRMINAYSHRIAKRYGEHFDDDERESMEIIQNATKRMDAMLSDLLKYAVAGIQSDDIKEVNLNDTLLIVKNQLKLRIKETQAQVVVGALPSIRGSSTSMIQLFQNIISNALKFRSEETPVIEITSEEREDHYLLAIRDNGIGIARKQQKYVFDIFHRIHPREKYEGTGIGLATCKKIIETLGR